MAARAASTSAGAAPINAKARAGSLADASIAATEPAPRSRRSHVIPMRAAIARQLDQAVVGARPNCFRVLRRECERADGRVRHRVRRCRLVASGSPSSLPPAVRSGLAVSQCMPLSCVASRYCVAR